jgi:hypothetical protein
MAGFTTCLAALKKHIVGLGLVLVGLDEPQPNQDVRVSGLDAGEIAEVYVPRLLDGDCARLSGELLLEKVD